MEVLRVDQCGLLRGSARSMQRLYRLICKVAPTSASVRACISVCPWARLSAIPCGA
jgi:hypothetical protein